MSIEGVRFVDAWPNRVATDFGGIPAHVISREDLLVNKRAAGRPQDQLDVSNLIEAEKTLKKLERAAKPKGGKTKRRDKGSEL